MLEEVREGRDRVEAFLKVDIVQPALVAIAYLEDPVPDAPPLVNLAQVSGEALELPLDLACGFSLDRSSLVVAGDRPCDPSTHTGADDGGDEKVEWSHGETLQTRFLVLSGRVVERRGKSPVARGTSPLDFLAPTRQLIRRSMVVEEPESIIVIAKRPAARKPQPQ